MSIFSSNLATALHFKSLQLARLTCALRHPTSFVVRVGARGKTERRQRSSANDRACAMTRRESNYKQSQQTAAASDDSSPVNKTCASARSCALPTTFVSRHDVIIQFPIYLTTPNWNCVAKVIDLREYCGEMKAVWWWRIHVHCRCRQRCALTWRVPLTVDSCQA